ncbi:MAG: MATE family efflux transporter [Prevotellaceae bacterium]|jgi:putative MATE family efflux protein|nr:MATE family efflux transporter [Prevotellaceae bacterium]
MKNFTQGKILPQLMSLALPIMGTGLAQLAYNFADIFWVGRLDSRSVAAVSIAGLIAWITFSIACVTKIGAEVCIAQAIGQRKLMAARQLAAHAVTISATISVITLALLLCFMRSIVGLFGMEAEINELCIDYVKIMAYCMPFWFFAPTFAGIYNATGNSRTPFVVSVIAILVNIVLDPFLIFGIGFFPALGVRGAAIATASSLIIEFFIFALLLLRPSTTPIAGFRFFTPLKRNLSLRLLKVGAPASLQSALFATLSLALSTIAASIGGHVGVAVQGAGSQIESLSWITANGVSTALGAYIGQNYGAQKLGRVMKSFTAGMGVVSFYGALVGVCFMLFGEAIFALFIPNDSVVIEEGGRYLYIFGISQMFLCAEIAASGAFNGLGRSYYPAVVTIVLNMLRIPMAIVLSRYMGLQGVWWAMCISTLIKGAVLSATFPIFIRSIKKRLRLQGAGVG